MTAHLHLETKRNHKQTKEAKKLKKQSHFQCPFKATSIKTSQDYEILLVNSNASHRIMDTPILWKFYPHKL